jgi:hypothetical protein
MGLKNWLNPLENKRFQVLLTIIFTCSLVFTQIKTFRLYRAQVGYWRVDNGIRDVIQRVEDLSDPTDFVLVMRSDAYINFATKRQSPTRFVYQTPLYMQGYATPQITEEYLQSILENKPALIIDNTNKWFDLDGLKAANASSPQVEILLNQIAMQYTVLENYNGWMIYKYEQPPK